MTDSTPRLLVVVADDEPAMLEVLTQHLKALRSPRFDVHPAEDGEQAWEEIRKVLPDLVVLDVMMPGMSGWEVCRKIRESPALAHTAVVILTGIGERTNEMTSPLFGADTHIDKPFESDALRARIDVLMGREPLDPPSAAAQVLKANPKSRTPKPPPVLAPPVTVAATMPVAVPVPAKVPSPAAVAPTVVAPAVKPAPAPKQDVSYDLNFSGGWGEEEAPAAEAAAADAGDDAWGGGWGDDGATAEGATAAAEEDAFGGGWGAEEAPAEETAAEDEAAAEGEEAGAEYTEGFGETAAEEAPAEDGWGGEFDATGYSAELTAEDAGEAAEEPAAEGEEAGAEYTEGTGEAAAEEAPAEDGWGGEFDATGYSAELTADAAGDVTEEAAAEESAEALAAEGAEEAQAQEGWGGEFDATGYAAELTADAATDEAAEVAAEYTEESVSDAEAADAAVADEEPADPPAPEDGWGGEFDAEGYPSELTAAEAEAESATTASTVPEAPASGSELRALATELDKLGLTAVQAAAVLKLTTQVVERAVWDVVPRLAEQIIREELDRLTRP